ncbi:phage tail tip lysozyme [Caballeronia sp. LZ035]|uniref:phage tail tip lysozyme n=1 Tax=Caballeronia sp. LZ035 TaxID=3038568 RepID=UPI0028557ACF|nr:phage tail tip lysozyme [Caballeronia sp. LZ035]MDR5757028.1 phage tail tip lysozyme [Caballeronia sp. LZ035]
MMRTSRSSQRMTAVQSFVTGATRASAMSGALMASVVGAVALVTSKILSIESTWANTVRSVSNKSLTLGIDARQLFGIQNAAKSVGLSAEQASSSVEGVTRGYYEASQGRDPQKRMIYQAYGISGRDESGQFSSEKLIEQIAKAGESVNSRSGPLARHRLFEALGADGLEDLLNKGQAGVRDRYARGVALAPSADDIRHANDYAEAMSRLDLQFDKTKSTILGSLAPALTTFLGNVEQMVKQIELRDFSVHAGVERVEHFLTGDGARTNAELKAQGTESNVSIGMTKAQQFGNWIRGNGARTNAQVAAEPNANVPYAIDYFERHGMTRNAAIGMTAGLLHESRIDPSAEGDNGQAYGVAQWHPDRAAGFEKWAGHSIKTSTLDEQLGYVMRELTQGDSQSRRAGVLMQSAASPADAARIASKLYERPAAADAEADARAKTADRIAGLYSAPGAAPAQSQDTVPDRKDGELRVKVELGNLPKGSRAEVSGTPNVKSTVERGSTGSTSQFALGATY